MWQSSIDIVKSAYLECFVHSLMILNGAGGVFEEAISIAALLIEPEHPIAATVRTTSGFIDNTFLTGHLSKEIFANHPGDHPGYMKTGRPRGR